MRKKAAAHIIITLFAILPAVTTLASWPEFFNRTADKKWSQAGRVIRTLALKKGQNVADIGAGGGYFSVLMARAVAPTGIIYAVDISPKSIRYIRQYARMMGARNVITILASSTNPGLKKKSVDLIFLRNTYHHIGNRVPYFKRLRKALNPGGRVVIIDYHPRIYPNHSTRESIIYGEMAAAGYRRISRYTFLSRQNFNIFIPE